MIAIVNGVPRTGEEGKGQALSAVKDRIANLEKGREGMKPGWLKEWETREESR